ncbi:MAG TPA: methyltransferase domain-containing protein [Gemmatimonadaceae bacterium]|nr:methyltransferase domain-containing protein [Gemmatimonadaceae bacterium]
METVGGALVAELERRFVTAVEPVSAGALHFALLKPANSDTLISEEDFARDDRLPYWADLWPSARSLAEWVVHEPGTRRTALELGCGLGLVTTSAMHAGFDVTATDYYEDALRFTRANAWRAMGREPRTRLVDWRALPADLGTYDLVLASDVLYEPTYAHLMASALARALASSGVAVIADPGRLSAEAFLQLCGGRGLRVESTEERPYADGDIRQTIRLHHIRRVDAGAARTV